MQNISGMAVGSVVQSPSTYGNHCEILLKRDSGPIHHSSRSHVSRCQAEGHRQAAQELWAPGELSLAVGVLVRRQVGRDLFSSAVCCSDPVCCIATLMSYHEISLFGVYWCCWFHAHGQNLGDSEWPFEAHEGTMAERTDMGWEHESHCSVLHMLPFSQCSVDLLWALWARLSPVAASVVCPVGLS